MRGPGNLSVGCLVGLTLFLGGCVNLNKTYPEKRSFVIEVTPEGRTASVDSDVVLKVNKFRVSPLFVGRAMVYRTGELQYESDFYDEWFVSPGAMLTQQVHGWLSKTGRFRIVLGGANHIEPTHLLEGSVTEFYGDYRVASAPQAVLDLELLVIDEASARDVVLQRTYRRTVPLKERSPDALAGGLSEALRLVLADFERDVVKVDFRSGRRPSAP